MGRLLVITQLAAPELQQHEFEYVPLSGDVSRSDVAQPLVTNTQGMGASNTLCNPAGTVDSCLSTEGTHLHYTPSASGNLGSLHE